VERAFWVGLRGLQNPSDRAQLVDRSVTGSTGPVRPGLQSESLAGSVEPPLCITASNVLRSEAVRSGRTTSLEQVSENNSRYLVTSQQFAKTYKSTPMYPADTTNAVKEEDELESRIRHVTFRTRRLESMKNDQRGQTRGQGRASDL